MTIKARFKGDSSTAFLDGVPARHLSDEEYAALDTETRKRVDASELYDVAGDSARRDKKGTD